MPDAVVHAHVPAAREPEAPPAIQVVDLVRDYPRPRTSLLRPAPVVHALRGVSLEVKRGERFGIVGESGCGKSTLLRIIAALDQPTSGHVIVEGTDITRLPERRLRFLRENLQLVFQDPMSSLDPRMRVRDIIAEPLVVQGHPASGERVRELLEAVGLSVDAGDRYPHQFSGGQRQRIGVARALALEPKLIVADEPVSALDVSIQAQVVNLLQKLQKELGIAFLFIAHDLAVVRHFSQRVAVMYLGRIVEIADRDDLYGNPRHPYTKALLSAVPEATADDVPARERIRLTGDVPSPVDPPSGCRFRTRCWKATDKCASETPPLVRIEGSRDGHLTACHHPEGPGTVSSVPRARTAQGTPSPAGKNTENPKAGG